MWRFQLNCRYSKVLVAGLVALCFIYTYNSVKNDAGVATDHSVVTDDAGVTTDHSVKDDDAGATAASSKNEPVVVCSFLKSRLFTNHMTDDFLKTYLEMTVLPARSIGIARESYNQKVVDLDDRVQLILMRRTIVWENDIKRRTEGLDVDTKGSDIVYSNDEFLSFANKTLDEHPSCTHISISRLDIDDPLSTNAYIGLHQDIAQHFVNRPPDGVRPDQVVAMRGDSLAPDKAKTFTSRGFVMAGAKFAPVFLVFIGLDKCHSEWMEGTPFLHSMFLTSIFPISAWRALDYYDPTAIDHTQVQKLLANHIESKRDDPVVKSLKKMVINAETPSVWLRSPFSSHFRWRGASLRPDMACSPTDMQKILLTDPRKLRGAGDRVNMSEEEVTALKETTSQVLNMTFPGVTLGLVEKNHYYSKRIKK